MSQWAAKGFDTYPVDTSVSLRSNKTKILGLTWQTLDNCLTLDTKGLLEFISTNKNTKRFLLQAIGKIFDPLGLISTFTIRMKCLIQELWKITWDEELPPKIVERGLSADSLLSDDKWWNVPSYLEFDELSGTDSECPELNEEEYLPELKSKDSKENVVPTLNLNQIIFDYLLTYNNRFLTIVRVLSFLFRFVFNCKNPGNKKKGPLTSEEMMEAEYFLLKHEQLRSFHTEMTAMRNGDDICHKIYCGKKLTEPSNGTMMPAIKPEELPTNISNLRRMYKRMGSVGNYFVDEAQHEEELISRPLSVFNLQHLPANCFAFNTVWGNASAVLIKATQRKGFKISLSTDADENFYISTPNIIQMAVHSPFMTVNPFIDGFSIQPCTTYKMHLHKIEKTLLPAPYPTNCTDYMTMWKERGGYGPLNQEMCIRECVFNRSIKVLGCFDPTVVSYPNDEAPFCFGAPDIDGAFEDCELNCQPACYEEEIQVKAEEFIFSDTENEPKRKKCLTGIEISFVRNQVMKFFYKQKYQIVEAFGYIGGFLAAVNEIKPPTKGNSWKILLVNKKPNPDTAEFENVRSTLHQAGENVKILS
ncbi:uncharacterized protein NPIL_49631 [Nephila pilipes]|uniref:Uncharacterized protein n=1 Tax=Nephila pilipes TaxID=299642 RepID=A0A8X6TP95_NEPPI|nr:uncharacterized protein NPIL_49631 [Nephila pilipes]